MNLDPYPTLRTQNGPPVKVGEQTIEWLPLASPSILPFTGTDYLSVLKALQSAFGPFPIRLTKDHVERLYGMMCAAGTGSDPYRILYEALGRFGEIEVR